MEEFARSILKTFYFFDHEDEIRKQNVGNIEEWHIVRWLDLGKNKDESMSSDFEPAAYGAVLLALAWLNENVTQSDDSTPE